MCDKITTCEKCGKELKYKTKKPRWCEECNPCKFYKQPSTGIISNKQNRSKLEFKIQKWVEDLFPNTPFIVNGYYSWLKSPKGYPMQIDLLIYGPKPWVALEIEGKQHIEKQYFQSEEEFEYLVECDRQKEWILKSKNIRLIKIYDDTCNTREDFEVLLKTVV